MNDAKFYLVPKDLFDFIMAHYHGDLHEVKVFNNRKTLFSETLVQGRFDISNYILESEDKDFIEHYLSRNLITQLAIEMEKRESLHITSRPSFYSDVTTYEYRAHILKEED